MRVLLQRLLIRPKELMKEVDLGNGQKLLLDYGEDEKRYQAAVTEGEVIAIGECAYRDYGYETSPVKIGDEVLFAKYAGAGVIDPITNEKLIVINDVDIICIVKEKTDE